MGELLQVEGVPQQAASHFEGAAGEVEARGVQGSDLVSGQCVDGGQGDDEAAERRLDLVEQPYQEVGGDGLGMPFRSPTGRFRAGLRKITRSRLSARNRLRRAVASPRRA